MSSTKYNIYYATTPSGPWTLANVTPLDHVDNLNSYTVTGLNTNTLYYFAIVGGELNESDEFMPFISQPIGPKPNGAGDVSSSPVTLFTAQTFSPTVKSNNYLKMQFEVEEIV